jgi:hypothetical protein
MPVLEPVVATLIANTAEFTAGLEAAKAKAIAFNGEIAASGAAGVGTGAIEGAVAAEQGLGKTEKAAVAAEKAAKNSTGGFSLLGSMLNKLPGPLGEARKKTIEYTEGMEKAGEGSSGLLGTITKIPNPMLIAGAAIAGVAAVSVNLAANCLSCSRSSTIPKILIGTFSDLGRSETGMHGTTQSFI